MRSLVCLVAVIVLPAAALAQDIDPARRQFEAVCGRCHGADGNGAEMGPSILERLQSRDDRQLATLVRAGIPDRGMPPSSLADSEMAALLRHLRTLERKPSAEAA